MGYIGIADDTIKKLAIEAMRHEEGDIKYEKRKVCYTLIKNNCQKIHTVLMFG